MELVVTGIGLLLTMGTIVFLGGRWVGGVNQRLDHHGALLEHHGALLEHHGALLANHGALLREIRNDLRRLLGRFPSATVAKGSPLQLTALGEQIARSLDAWTWADQMAGSLRDRVSGMRPDQIREFGFQYVYEYEPDPELAEEISIAADENGIDQTQVLDVLAVVLRDELAGRVANRTS